MFTATEFNPVVAQRDLIVRNGAQIVGNANRDDRSDGISTQNDAKKKLAKKIVDADDLIVIVERLVQRHTNRGIRNMRIVCENGNLILSGYCTTFYTKQLAQQAIVNMIGDMTLINDIHVG